MQAIKRLTLVTAIVTSLFAMGLPAHATTASTKTPLTKEATAMRDMILKAVRAGDLNALLEAIQWNELPPSFAEQKVDDPIAFFKAQSVDKAGFQHMALLRDILESTHATRKAPNGPADFIWPAAADRPWKKLSPSEKVDVLRILPADQAKAYVSGKPYSYFSVMIGADGTWHAFEKEDR